MPKWAKKAIDVTTSVVLGIFVIFVILLVGVRIFGIEPHIVLSGSMEPEIMTGSLVYVDKLTPEEARELQPGDTVTYQVDQKGTKVTHKIYNVVGRIPIYDTDDKGNPKLDENGDPIIKEYAKDPTGEIIYMYTTYGVNNVRDGKIENALDGDPEIGNLASSNVVGKPLFSIPLLGYIAHFVQNPPGKYIVLIGCVMMIFMTFFAREEGDAESTDAGTTATSEGPKEEDNDEQNTDDTTVKTDNGADNGGNDAQDGSGQNKD